MENFPEKSGQGSSQESPRKPWFKAKHYGWGWYPVTWQGWLVLVVYLVLVVGELVVIDRQSHSVSDTLLNFVPDALGFTVILLLICYWKGEKPGWRWGKKK